MSRRNVEAAVAGLVAAIVTFFVGWVTVRVVLLAMVALAGWTPFAPAGLWTYTCLLAAAAAAGLIVGIRGRPPKPGADYRVSAKRATVAVTVAAILAGGWVGGWWVAEQRQEPDYLDAFKRSSFRTTGDDVLLAAGHQACDWLQGRPWGTPPLGQADGLGPEGPEVVPFQRYGNVEWRYNPPTNSLSTDRLLVSYGLTIASPDHLSTADDELLFIAAAEPAWFELCPSSQWIRRPAGSFNDGGD